MKIEPAPRRRLRTRLAAVASGLAVTVAVAACADDAQGPPVISLYYAPEQNLPQVVEACNEQAAGRYRIDYQVLPRDADEQRVQMVRRLAAQDNDMDILGLDVTWTQEFASAEWIREWTGAYQAEAEQDTLPAALESASYEGRLYAAPKNTNVQLLWYRTDLVDEPPATWDEMIEMSRQLRDQGQPYQIITMGAQYEGLVVLYNTLTESAGGQIVNEAGDEAVVDQGAVAALALLQRFATAGVTSPAFANAMEDDARLAFQAGDAAFQLNWPYVYPAMQQDAPELAENVGWARYPAVNPGEPSRVTAGGFNLAISAYSRHPQEAFEAALCLRNPENQLFSAVNDGVPPTIESVYDDPELESAYPMGELILETLLEASNRPLTPAYQNVSTVMSTTLSPPAAIEPEATAARLRDQIQAALESRGVLP
jgi:multiple sugar transport system substrate-binding protein